MQQAVFPFSIADKYNQDEFIESAANVKACQFIQNWPTHWGVKPYPKALIIKGNQYCGKTFLAQRWAQRSSAIFIDQDFDLSTDLLSIQPAFIIEDFDYNWPEGKLLHFFNLCMESDKYLLMTCTYLPEFRLADLASRIRSLNITTINDPDDLMMEMLIFKLFSNYAVIIEKDIVNFLIKYLPRNFPSIIKMVEKINQCALKKRRKITIPLIKEILN